MSQDSLSSAHWQSGVIHPKTYNEKHIVTVCEQNFEERGLIDFSHVNFVVLPSDRKL